MTGRCRICAGLGLTTAPTGSSKEALSYLCEKLQLPYSQVERTITLCDSCQTLWEDFAPLYHLVNKKVGQFQDQRQKTASDRAPAPAQVKIEPPGDVIDAGQRGEEYHNHSHTYSEYVEKDDAFQNTNEYHANNDGGESSGSEEYKLDFFSSILSTEGDNGPPPVDESNTSKHRQRKRKRKAADDNDGPSKRQRMETNLTEGCSFPTIEVARSLITSTGKWSEDKQWNDVDGVKLGFFCKQYWQGCGARLQVIAPVGSKECHVGQMDTFHTHLSETKRPAYGINSTLKGQIVELVQQGMTKPNAIIKALTTSGFEPPPERLLGSFLVTIRTKLWEKEKTRRIEENAMTNFDIPRRKRGAWSKEEKQLAAKLVPGDFEYATASNMYKCIGR